ncbi:hypothetical protein [Mangrovivirga cuniculi]|uniref:Uncharacterized protein n=1 Tax=Mangrovivirga cuniculi TaxID=2715131 RepID=A0A4D7JS64_9BACT|nr:hypothetical protein [Mangrovivirga cuniculi]QCK13775.1 hypothetical protein DCC35_02880 [Mangrovivirga cuniculi]
MSIDNGNLILGDICDISQFSEGDKIYFESSGKDYFAFLGKVNYANNSIELIKAREGNLLPTTGTISAMKIIDSVEPNKIQTPAGQFTYHFADENELPDISSEMQFDEGSTKIFEDIIADKLTQAIKGKLPSLTITGPDLGKLNYDLSLYEYYDNEFDGDEGEPNYQINWSKVKLKEMNFSIHYNEKIQIELAQFKIYCDQCPNQEFEVVK